MPLLHRADGRLMAEGLLVDVVIVKPGVSLDGLIEITSASRAMSLQYLGDPAIKTLHHAVGGRMARTDEAMLDPIHAGLSMPGYPCRVGSVQATEMERFYALIRIFS